jgi:hypothetical protein
MHPAREKIEAIVFADSAGTDRMMVVGTVQRIAAELRASA